MMVNDDIIDISIIMPIYNAEKYLRKNKDYYGFLNSIHSSFMPKESLIIPGMDKMSVEETIDYTYDLSKRVYDFKKIISGIDKVREKLI